ncbi:hypothetical protein [Gemmatimonas sp.]|uniref:hypothetical protein n=1 Tax=Gemmatimonas sp. TaxID=1962908 RepID=UPI00286AF58D|nr:hypothetical protein [Gemmatimonas sp.]
MLGNTLVHSDQRLRSHAAVDDAITTRLGEESMRSVYARTVAVLASLATGACADTVDQPAEPQARNSRVEAVTSSKMRPAEAMLFAMEQETPGFGGFYLDQDGTAHVFVKDAARGGTAQFGMQRRFSSGELPLPAGQRLQRVNVRAGQFSISELAAWRDLLFDAISNNELPSAVKLDLNEQTNRVKLVVESGVFRADANKLIGRLAIPSGAVTVEVGTRPTDARSLANARQVLDQWRPMLGGVGISWHLANGTVRAGCTSGFTMRKGSGFRIVTASHCSSSEWSVDASLIKNSPQTNLVGTESEDPSGYSCGLRTCRGSDAAAFTPPSGVALDVGYIARMRGFGQLYEDSTASYWIVSDVETNNMYVGQVVYRQGATTGLVQGNISDTCDDYFNSWNRTRTCQTDAILLTNQGDSGGPIFWVNGQGANYVTLAGIASAVGGSGNLIFSAYQRVATDLGIASFDVKHSSTFPAQPVLSGSIVNGYPQISWPSVATATAYHLYRQWYRYGTEQGSNGYEYMGTVTSSWAGDALPVDAYTGTSFPNFSTPGYVSYYLFATNSSGRSSPASEIKHFRLAP